MSASSLEQRIPTIDRAWDALEAGDIDAFMEVARGEVHPEVEFKSGIGTVVGGGTYKGVDGIREWFSDFLSVSRDRRWANRRYEIFGDDILVFFATLEFTGEASEVPVTSETGAVVRYRDGRAVRMDSFTSHQEAREFAEALVA